ncbi:hypothetical protein [Mobilicoccus sp.]|uniref:hypothetical protein n=1 Tax=Mobilicoccus sp. TaxID=2034349 RepID=UPI0028A80C0D|nr:hypothetical protein [Mobilicoccus sp.]
MSDDDVLAALEVVESDRCGHVRESTDGTGPDHRIFARAADGAVPCRGVEGQVRRDPGPSGRSTVGNAGMPDREVCSHDESVSGTRTAVIEDEPRSRVSLHGGESCTAGRTDTIDITVADLAHVIDRAQRRTHGDETHAIALVVDDEAEESLDRGHGSLGADPRRPMVLSARIRR